MIIVNNLTKVFQQQNGEELYAVNDLSFTADKGEIVVLEGIGIDDISINSVETAELKSKIL